MIGKLLILKINEYIELIYHLFVDVSNDVIYIYSKVQETSQGIATTS